MKLFQIMIPYKLMIVQLNKITQQLKIKILPIIHKIPQIKI